MRRRAIAPASTMSGTCGRRAPTARSPTSRSAPDGPDGGAVSASGSALLMNDETRRRRRVSFLRSPDLAELREGFDQPDRNALKPASQKCDAGRDEQDAHGFLDPAELRAQMARRADEGPDRGGREDEGQP